MPRCGFIPDAVTRLTGLEYHAGKMYQQCGEILAQETRDPLMAFNEWLLALPRRLLVTYNARMLVAKYQEEKLPFPPNTAFATPLDCFVIFTQKGKVTAYQVSSRTSNEIR